MPAPKKAATLVAETEHELADLAVRIEQERRKRETALLMDDGKAVDAYDLTLDRLRKTQGREQEKLRLWQEKAVQEEQAAVNKRRAALHERIARKASKRGDRAVTIQTLVANLVTEYREMLKESDELRAAWPIGNSHTNAAAGSPEGAALSGGAIKALLAQEFYRASADPFLGGVPGERRLQSLPGAVCLRQDLQLQPEKITPFADNIKQANSFLVETLTTTLDPLRALNVGEAVAPVDSDARTPAERKHAELTKELYRLSADITPEGEAKYMQVEAELARLSSEP